ncbi:hypothetical protein [Clostridium sp. HCS.1]|uniref:hypothetical protein n=1 Tax=Clostridium sp. HCS.1 TaxID=3238594 RepID=UPI003A100E9F
MNNGKNFIRAFLLSIVIIIGFLILFELIGFDQEQTSIAVATIIVFTMLYCTYSIIDEIRDTKNTKE